MSKLTAKRVLRAMRPINEAATPKMTVAAESRAIKFAINAAAAAQKRAESWESKAAKEVAALALEVAQMQVDASARLNYLMDDRGRSGVDSQVSAIDNFQDDLSDYESELADAYDHLTGGDRLKLRTKKGVDDIPITAMRSQLSKIRSACTKLSREARKSYGDLFDAYDELESVLSRLDHEEVFNEYEEDAEALITVLQDLAQDHRFVQDTLENLGH